MANPSELELLEVILPEGYLLFEEEGRSFIHHRDRPTLSISIEPQHGVKDVLMLLLNERWEAGFEKGKAKPQEEEPEPLDLDGMAADCLTEAQQMIAIREGRGELPPARLGGYMETGRLNEEQLADLELNLNVFVKSLIQFTTKA